MEFLPEQATQPIVEYEGEVYARAGNLIPRDLTKYDDISAIIGFEAIDTHLEQLFDKWEEHGDLNAAIDACTIISQFPEHYDSVPTDWYDNIYGHIYELLRSPYDELGRRELVIHCMQVPELYARLTSDVLNILRSTDPNGLSIREDVVVNNYLDIYASEVAGVASRYQVLYHLVKACNSTDSEL